MNVTKEEMILTRAITWMSEDAGDGIKEAQEIVEGLKGLVKLFDSPVVSKMLPEIIVSLNNGEKIKAIKCSECDCYFEKKEIQIQGNYDTCDDCLCPE